MFYQIKSFTKEIKIIKWSSLEVLDLKSTITEIKKNMYEA